jgi:hypothetical protein
MKRIFGMAIAAGVFAWGAAAQDDADQAKARLQKMVAEAKVMGVKGGVMGPAVKGAPILRRRSPGDHASARRRHAHSQRKQNHRLSRQ